MLRAGEDSKVLTTDSRGPEYAIPNFLLTLCLVCVFPAQEIFVGWDPWVRTDSEQSGLPVGYWRYWQMREGPVSLCPSCFFQLQKLVSL